MKKLIRLFLIQVVSALLLSSCQLISFNLPTPTISTTGANETPEIVNPATSTPLIVKTATPNTSQSTTTPTPSIILQTGSPAYIQNFVHTEEGCAWLGVAGQVFDTKGKPINNLVVNVKGTLGSDTIDKIGVTGIPEANFYGPGGYEIKIGDKPISTVNTLSINVLDLNGMILSKRVTFNTYSDCKKNLIIINFKMK